MVLKIEIGEIEPEALRAARDVIASDQTRLHIFLASAAISLKRIADVLDGSPEKLGLVDAVSNAIENTIHHNR